MQRTPIHQFILIILFIIPEHHLIYLTANQLFYPIFRQ